MDWVSLRASLIFPRSEDGMADRPLSPTREAAGATGQAISGPWEMGIVLPENWTGGLDGE
jgi:hypothetical protein